MTRTSKPPSGIEKGKEEPQKEEEEAQLVDDLFSSELDNQTSSMLRRGLNARDDRLWFINIFAPEMENTLRNAITNEVVRGETKCFGSGGRVEVEITWVGRFRLRCGRRK